MLTSLGERSVGVVTIIQQAMFSALILSTLNVGGNKLLLCGTVGVRPRPLLHKAPQTLRDAAKQVIRIGNCNCLLINVADARPMSSAMDDILVDISLETN
ncbi:hypothetical protein PVK06_018803 [Gossypium arboreum]|uniref:Uncharacterized protein n=1 Tax=Gossypium arboreum TaxID=29729 RepID=A0ABR0PIN5_GOSAR|nr:hypothetical protein PVK06_018803 [Gossypium arboreum]